jgi:hypothetical protein
VRESFVVVLGFVARLERVGRDLGLLLLGQSGKGCRADLGSRRD